VSNLEVKLTLVGGPTVLVEIAGFRILTDPTFDLPGKYEAGGVVLEKTAGPALTEDEVGVVDLALVSHDQHFDNLDRAGRTFLTRAKTTCTTRAGATRLGHGATGLSPWETVTVEGKNGNRLHVTTTPARHGPAGFEPVSGEVVGFALGIDQRGDAIYVSGDTVWYEGVAEVVHRFKPRLVIVFAGSAKPRGPFRVTMDNNDAVETAHAFPQARIVIVHNHGWTHFTESQADAVQVFNILGIASRLQTLEPGKQVSIKI
jgi:L-ascorbate metabolism protein UlaG (beta-lactamase superfamily)